MALISPKKIKTFNKNMAESLPYWLWAIICFAFAYIFWQSQAFFRAPLLIQILAILSAAKGLVLLVLPKRKINKMLGYWTFQVSDLFYRFYGLVIMIVSFYLYSAMLY